MNKMVHCAAIMEKSLNICLNLHLNTGLLSRCVARDQCDIQTVDLVVTGSDRSPGRWLHSERGGPIDKGKVMVGIKGQLRNKAQVDTGPGDRRLNSQACFKDVIACEPGVTEAEAMTEIHPVTGNRHQAAET